MEFNQSLYKRRQRANAVGLSLSMGAMVLGLFVLLWILSVLFSNGLAALDWNMFTQSTPAPGSEGGGLANAIVGSLMMVGFTVLVSTPIGIFAGVYLAEYGDQSKTAELTRFVTDIMLSAPSIVLGLRLLMLTACRPGEVRGARWAEFDLKTALWTIPPERMKMREEHRVPLSKQALEVLGKIEAISGGRELVFPSPYYPSKPLSENTFNSAMARMGNGDFSQRVAVASSMLARPRISSIERFAMSLPSKARR